MSQRIPRIPDKPLGFIAYVLRHCSRQMKTRALVAMFFQAFGIACDVTVAWALGRIVGVVISSTPETLWPELTRELILFATIWIARGVAFRLRERQDRIYVPELLNTTQSLLFRRLIRQSQMFLNNNFAGVLANHVRRAGDIISALRDKLYESIVPLFVRFVTAGVLLWSITPYFALFILVFVAIGTIVGRLTAGAWTRISLRQAEAASRLTGYIVDGVTNLSLVRQNVGWEEEQGRLDAAHHEMSAAYRARLWYTMWFWGIFDAAMTFFYCGFMVILAYAWSKGGVTAAQMSMTVGVVTNLFGALAGAVHLLNAKFDDLGILEESLQKISTPFSIMDVKGARDLQVTQGRIEFRGVDFAYPGKERLFCGLSLTVAPGEKVGLVGVSGAGKTTLCQLLLRAHDVTGGGIFIDGQNIAGVTQDSLHAAIAVIPQDPILFHRTLAENIRYGRFGATDAEVREAARLAAIDGFIEGLPEGYDTLVGERGVKLSGGQRQRIAIARAIIKASPLLVLDEATSALDSATERTIQSSIAEAMKGRTTLVVAHRLSTLRHMDRIIVMENGRIVEEGGFSQLIAANGTFARLWSMQAGGFLPEKF